MKKFLSKFFSILLILTMCFAGTGCLEIFGVGNGLDFFDDLWEKFQNGEISEEEYYEQLENSQSTPLYGTKVLYRPDHYDFNTGSGGTEEEENNYYGQYAWQILRRLELIYGVVDTTSGLTTGYYIFDDATLPYLYDSIRYQVDEYKQISNSLSFDGENWSSTSVDYTNMSANLNNAWNWSFEINEDDLNSLPYLYYEDAGTPLVKNTSEISTLYRMNLENFTTGISDWYLTTISTKYLNIYLGTSDAKETETEKYSDFVKALEYVIYCYSLDLTPGEVEVVPVMQNGKYYQVTIYETVNGVRVSMTVDEALEKIKETFDKLGTYVGIAERNKIKIQNWILENVIGQDAMANDSVIEYTNATQITYGDKTFVATNSSQANQKLDELGYTGDDIVIDNATFKTEKVGRDYQATVEKIIDGVCNEVTIGGNEDDDVNVDDRFLASEIMEYWGNSFAPGGDEDPFPYFEDFESGKGARAIRPLEYQSAVIMFKEEVNVTSLTVAFQYDADLDGYQTATGEAFDGSRYLTIEVGLNYFNHATGEKTVVQTKTINVPDGKLVDLLGDDNLDEASKKAGVEFSQRVDFGLDEPILGNWKKDLICGAFNVDIGNGILKTDVGENDYRGNPFVSQDPITIVGTTSVKDYYEIIEPTEEQIAKGETYLTGQLNAEKFKGSDGCDYLEVTYRVIKKVGDTTTNYKFYTGITITAENV